MFKKKPLDLDPRILKRLFRQENEVQVMVYWEDHYEVLVELLLMEKDEELVQKAIYLLGKSLNLREKYTWTSFIYHKLFVAKNRFQGQGSRLLNDIKFELGKGLHFSREYADAKRLFDDLNRVEDFDHSLYEDWYDHTVTSSKREQYLDSNSFLLPLSKFLFSMLYLILVFVGLYPVYATVVFVIIAISLQFGYYWDKTAAHFGTFKKHRKEVRALQYWLYAEGTIILFIAVSGIYFFNIDIQLASILVASIWLAAILFNLIFLKKLRGRIAHSTS